MIAIIDDDLLFAGILKEKLLQYNKNYEIKVLSYFDEKFLDNNDIEILFLDIELGDQDGIELASKYRESGHDKVEIVFVSVHNGLVFHSMVAYPRYFVRKLNLDQDLEECMHVIRNRNRRKNAKILVNDEMIMITDILFVKSKRNYVYYTLLNKETIKQRTKISIVEEVLKEYNFVRCHLSYLINVAYIERVGKDFVALKNNILISVSKSRYNEVLNTYKQYRFE
ncbi:MAG: LytR/AlgR family response regulator transcription factor [Thomasclavelia sp.]|uniref:LytR/AlgR family response regulator transcription factor n=1 Tax=Thomasclavelia sp. TaxID=3025757 RepID=UPI0039A270E3